VQSTRLPVMQSDDVRAGSGHKPLSVPYPDLANMLLSLVLVSIFSEKPADEGDDTGVPLFTLAFTHLPESWPVASSGLC
jgi:hypothetical protein